MSTPAGITRRNVSFGSLSSIEAGDDLSATITIASTVPYLVWAASGDALVSNPYSVTIASAADAVVPLIPTDLEGWTINGAAVDVSDGKQSHAYTVVIQVMNGIAKIGKPITYTNLIVPSGTTTLDADTTATFLGPTGDTISVPVTLQGFVDDATAAAVAAATSESNASDSATTAATAATTATTAKTDAVSAKTDAESARDDAQAAAVTATAPTDTQVAGLVPATSGSATAAALSAAIASQAVTLLKPEQFAANVGVGGDDTAAFVAMLAAGGPGTLTACHLTPGKTYNVNTGALTWGPAQGNLSISSVGGRRAATIVAHGTGAGTSLLHMAWPNTAAINPTYELSNLSLVGAGVFDALIQSDDVVDASLNGLLISGDQGQQADIWVRNVIGWSEQFSAHRVRELNRNLNTGSGRLFYFDSTGAASASFARAQLTNIGLSAGNLGSCKIDMSASAAVYDSWIGPVVGNISDGVRCVKITGNMRGTVVHMPQIESGSGTGYAFEYGALSGGGRPEKRGTLTPGSNTAEWAVTPPANTVVWQEPTLPGAVIQNAQNLQGVDLLGQQSAALVNPLNPAFYTVGSNTGPWPFNQIGNLVLQLASTGRQFVILDSTGAVIFDPYTTATTTSLQSATADINTRAKRQGKMVWNTNAHRPVYAAGPAATDVWYDATGAVAHTPA